VGVLVRDAWEGVGEKVTVGLGEASEGVCEGVGKGDCEGFPEGVKVADAVEEIELCGEKVDWTVILVSVEAHEEGEAAAEPVRVVVPLTVELGESDVVGLDVCVGVAEFVEVLEVV